MMGMTDRYAVIGHPIGHSKSPFIHRAFADATGQDLVYTAIDAPVDGFAAAVDAFRAAGGRGLNVTVPFKLDACRYATERSPRAEMAGAANAMRFDGTRVEVENFDGIGLVRDVVHNLQQPMQGQRVLLLGAGGATRGVLLPFLQQGVVELVIANRDLDKAQAVAALGATHGPVRASSYAALAGLSFDLVFNGTSASLSGELPPVAPSVFAPGALAYEMVYGKGLTPFLRLAASAGVTQLADGVGMLAEQAAEAFAWWRGVRPDTRAVINALTVPLT
jgi:shikimate dehydrogenase